MFAFPRLSGTSIFVLYSLPAYRQGYKWFPISLKMRLASWVIASLPQEHVMARGLICLSSFCRETKRFAFLLEMDFYKKDLSVWKK